MAGLLEQQRQYDDLCAYFLGYDPSNMRTVERMSIATWELHKRVVRILEGREPDPRTAPFPLPYHDVPELRCHRCGRTMRRCRSLSPRAQWREASTLLYRCAPWYADLANAD